jgi:polyisoprenoid-binding protein YceI
MKRILGIALLLTVLVAFSARAETYNIDPDHSQAMFKVRHLSIGWVTGRFSQVEGSFDFEESKMNDFSVATKIMVDSLNTDVKKRDKHLKSPDFFNEKKHPKMIFVSTKTFNANGDRFQVAGELTIRGVTKDVVFDVVYEGKVNDPWGFERTAFTAETQLNRHEFDISWKKKLGPAKRFVGNVIEVSLEIEGTRKPAE